MSEPERDWPTRLAAEMRGATRPAAAGDWGARLGARMRGTRSSGLDRLRVGAPPAVVTRPFPQPEPPDEE
jgi:hypothetical protein